MRIEDKGIILSTRKFGEKSLIINLLSENHGVISGIVTVSKKDNNKYQQGNLVCFTWNARLQEHLGKLTVSVEKSYTTTCYDSYQKILSISSLCSLILELFPERERIEYVFSLFYQYLDGLVDDNDKGRNQLNWLKSYSMLKLELLKASGFGFDFSRCSETGDNNVFYISPKTGASVCREIGEPYKDKLFTIPVFFLNTDHSPTLPEILQGLEITRFFIARHIFAEKGKNTPFAYEEFYSQLRKNI